MKYYDDDPRSVADNRMRKFDYEYGNIGRNIFIPSDYSKFIKLTNAGRLTGSIIPSNRLDSIAKYAGIEKFPIKTAIGLAGKESNIGLYPSYMTPDLIRLAYADLNFYKHDTSGSDIFNYERQDNPYVDLINEASRKAGGMKKNISGFYDNDLDLPKYLKFLKNGLPYADKIANSGQYDNIKNKNTIQRALILYKNHPELYNPGLENYLLMVNKVSNEAWNSPEIQNWWKDSGYYWYNNYPKYRTPDGEIKFRWPNMPLFPVLWEPVPYQVTPDSPWAKEVYGVDGKWHTAMNELPEVVVTKDL